MEDLLDRLKTALTDRYVIKQELGAGGMATVYLADDVRHGRQVALKLLKPELGAVLGGERFLREIHIAASLSHPHILPLYDSGEVDGLFFYVMPYVAGESLRERLDRHTQLSIEEAIELTRQVASALDYAHREGVIHRDIKPENILLQEGQAVVADFGIARAVREAGGERLTETGLSLGTPAYMSPEQASGAQQLDARTDIYALGCVLYEMLAGDPPFTGPTGQAVIARQLVDPPPSIRTVRPTVPEELERAIEKALAKIPADRYEVAGAFVEAAGAAAQIMVAPTRERRALERDHRRQKLVRSLVPAAAGAAVAIVAVAAWLLWPRGPTLDPHLIAVAPFDAIGSGVESWREDAPTLLYSRLDGAGRWRAIPPSIVRARWTERADAATASDLAAAVGAGLVLFGHVVSTGNDSVQLEATLFDAAAGHTIYQFRESGPVEPMLTLSDAATVEVMAALSRDYVPASIRWTSFGTSDPEAIKEFLTGEEHFRSFRPDSARLHYERAVNQDSSFALAYRRLAYASDMAEGLAEDVWGLFPPWGANDALRLKAGSLNRGLARRESLLVAADSVWAAARVLGKGADVEVGSEADSLYLRLFSTLETARQSFRQDPELLFLLGHLVFAKGAAYGQQPEIAVDALKSVVALDPEFLPGYLPLLFLELFHRAVRSPRRRFALCTGVPARSRHHCVGRSGDAGREAPGGFAGGGARDDHRDRSGAVQGV
jgi:serine/threonine-protein kinase